MTALTKKLFRDLVHLWAQALAIMAVVASGIAIFVAMLGTYGALETTLNEYYERFRFAQVFARVERAPRTLIGRIESIPGVAEVEARVVADMSASLPGVHEPVIIRFVSIPERPPFLNGIYLRSGSMPEADDEIVLNEVFAEANRLSPGDRLTATLHGHEKHLKIVGIGLSPEHIFQLRGTELFPDNHLFGVAWIEERALGSAMDMTGAFNDVSLVLAANASEKDVIQALDDLLAPYGGVGAHGRDKLLSHFYLTEELKQLRGNAYSIPIVFLGVAAFLLNVVLARLVAMQRSQIGTLKAFGYSDAAIGLHFLELVLLIVLAGTIIGVFVGAWLGSGLTEMYHPYYRFPELVFLFEPRSVGAALLIALGAASVGALGAVRRAVRLPPAEAMRPEPPPAFRALSLDGPMLRRLLSTVPRMILRNLLRRPVRTALSVLGIALGGSIVVVGLGTQDAIDKVFTLQYEESERQDVTVLFLEARPTRAAEDLIHLPGVLRVEPFRATPVTLKHGHLEKQLGITGLSAGGTLKRLVDRDEQVVTVPPEGLVLSRYLAEKLAVGRGDMLEVELLEGKRRTRWVPVTGVIDDLLGVSAFMDADALDRLTESPRLATGAFLQTDARESGSIYDRLRDAAQVASVALRERTMIVFRETMEQNMTTALSFEIVCSLIIAFSVVFNNARTALSERERELATLRVLGFGERETAAVLLGELAAVTVLSMPVGMLIGYLLTALVMGLMGSELYRIPVAIDATTYTSSAVVVAVATIASFMVVTAKVKKLDLVSVLKTRD
ncbi:MAG: ABC transporter permease [Byssovorax sp.]